MPGVILIALTGVAGIVDVDVCDRNSEKSFSRICSLCVPFTFTLICQVGKTHSVPITIVCFS